MKQEVVIALKNSLIGDTSTLQKSNEKLSELSASEGYCMCLMEVIDEPTFDIPLKQAALVQLKNNVKAKWKPKNEKLELTPNQKNHIRSALILAVIRCSNKHMLIKLYREVLTTVIGYEYETWVPLQEIITRLKAGENLVPVFHCIIAISTNFQFSVVEKEKNMFNEFLKEVLPAVFETVKNNIDNAELVYLSLKILWKAVHYDIQQSIKVLTNPWMELILLTITAYNEEMQKNLDEIQNKNTHEFYYYHSKKWATRILMRFVQKHAKSYQFGKLNEENVEYSKFWYENYGIKLCEAIVKHLEHAVPTTKKIRYFQLKIIQGILQDKPELIAQHSKHFQYDILIKYMTLTQQDETTAKDDVVEYLRSYDDMSVGFSNVKRAATDVWNCFMQLESKLDRENNCYMPGPLFEENMQFMLAKISSQNLLEKQLGMFLFCENRITINRVPAVKGKMQEILNQYVVPELANSAILIRAKANDMFCEYGKQIHDYEIIKKSIEGIFKCLTQDESALVRIKAALALNPIISNKDSKQLLQPYLKEILQVYLKLIQQYDLQQIVSALEYFIGDFSQSIGPFALDLFKYLSSIFVKMFNKDIELSQNDDYGSEVELAASGCIKTMTQILESPLDPTIRQQLQPCVLELCAFLFTNQSLDYTEDLMFLMRVHVERVDKITPPLWFFYQVIIYFIAGIPAELWKQIETLPLPQANKQVLSNIRTGNNIQFLQHVIPVLRNYFGKGYHMIVAQKDEFKTNFIHLIFYLVNYVYKRGSSNNSDLSGEIHFDCCTILLVYLIETFPPEMTKPVIGNIWNICKYNLIKGKSTYLKQITIQLLAVVLWKHPIDFIQILNKESQLHVMIKNICDVAPRLEESQQRKRVVLGICSYFGIIGQNFEVLSKFAPALFKILLKMVKKNSRTRIILNTTESELKKKLLGMQDASDDGNDYDDDEDDDDMWDEEYNEKHVSLLKEINELQVFKATMENMGINNQQFYGELVKTVKAQTLGQVQQLLDQAIQLKQK